MGSKQSDVPAHVMADITKEANAFAIKNSNPYTTQGLKYRDIYKEAVMPYAVQAYALDKYLQKVNAENKQLHELTGKLFDQIEKLTKELADSVQSLGQANQIIKKLLDDGNKL